MRARVSLARSAARAGSETTERRSRPERTKPRRASQIALVSPSDARRQFLATRGHMGAGVSTDPRGRTAAENPLSWRTN